MIFALPFAFPFYGIYLEGLKEMMENKQVEIKKLSAVKDKLL